MSNIAMWSGPRNISTALMYAFANRADCTAWDEPFYAAYLAATGLAHPMRAEILAANGNDAAAIATACERPGPKPVFYQKHMTHHMLPAFPRGFIHGLNNAFLIRAPEKVLASYARKHGEVSLHAIGFVEQAEIFDEVAQQRGKAPPVVDADQLLANPRGHLVRLCKALKIPFDEAMLAWPPGPKPCDGIWAPHWYNAVWQSQGFGAPTPMPKYLPAKLARIADEARPFYEKLKAHALQVA